MPSGRREPRRPSSKPNDTIGRVPRLSTARSVWGTRCTHSEKRPHTAAPDWLSGSDTAAPARAVARAGSRVPHGAFVARH